MKILEGKKTILFPFEMTDFDFFFKVYSQTEKHKLGELRKLGDEKKIKLFLMNAMANGLLVAWVAYTKEGKASKKGGVIYIFDITQHSCSVHGIIDKDLLKGLATRLKSKKKLTYTEDALRTVVKFCFGEFNRERVDTNIPVDNRLAIKLAEKVGFKKEGVLRKYAKIGDKTLDVAIYSMLKGEYKDVSI